MQFCTTRYCLDASYTLDLESVMVVGLPSVVRLIFEWNANNKWMIGRRRHPYLHVVTMFLRYQ